MSNSIEDDLEDLSGDNDNLNTMEMSVHDFPLPSRAPNNHSPSRNDNMSSTPPPHMLGNSDDSVRVRKVDTEYSSLGLEGFQSLAQPAGMSVEDDMSNNDGVPTKPAHSEPSNREESPLFEPEEYTSNDDVQAPTQHPMTDGANSSAGESDGLTEADSSALPAATGKHRKSKLSHMEVHSQALTGKKRQLKPLRVRVSEEERIIIKELREQNMQWSGIAEYLNNRRRQRDELPSHTEASVYGQFTRNAPRIAAKHGDFRFDPRDYMYLKDPKVTVDPDYQPGTGATKRRRSEAKDDIFDTHKELKNNIRQPTKRESMIQDLNTREKREMLKASVEMVEKNYWMFVADAMEEKTGRLYPADVLKKCFKKKP